MNAFDLSFYSAEPEFRDTATENLISFQAYLDNTCVKTGKAPDDFAKLAAE